MVTALVQFPLPASVSRDKAAELFDTPVVVDNATGEISSDA